MRVLVVGGAGLLGSRLAERFVEDGHDVAICDNFSGSIHYRAPKGIRTFTANATDLNSFSHVFRAFDPEIVVLSVGHYFSADTIYRSIEDTRLVLSSADVTAYLLGPTVKQVIFCSSHEVYDGSSRPIKETKRIVQPYSPHGAAKLAAETVLTYKCGALGIPLTTVRIFELFGPRVLVCAKTGVLSFLIDSLLSHEQIGISGPKRLKDFIHVDDAVEALRQMVSGEVSGTFNLGTGTAHTLVDVVKGLSGLLDITYPPQLITDREGKKKSLVADISKLKEFLPDWEPHHKVLDSLEALVAFRKDEARLYDNSVSSSPRILAAMRGQEGV